MLFTLLDCSISINTHKGNRFPTALFVVVPLSLKAWYRYDSCGGIYASIMEKLCKKRNIILSLYYLLTYK